METNRKRRGFMKGKLVMSIYKATKPSSATAPYNSKLGKPSTHHPPSVVVGGGGGGFIVNQTDHHLVNQSKQKVPQHPPNHVEFIVKQEQVVPQPKQKVSFLLPAADSGGRDSYGIQLHDNLYHGVAVDESVDLKATTYISTVRERLKLHRVNSELKKLQDMQ